MQNTQQPPLKYMFGQWELSRLLLADWVARKHQEWRLVPVDKASILRTRLAAFASIKGIRMFVTENLLVVPSPRSSPSSLASGSAVITLVADKFSMAQAVLDAFRGHLVLAGGSLCSAVVMGEMGRPMNPNDDDHGDNEDHGDNDDHGDGDGNGKSNGEPDDMDADFFFVNVTKECAKEMLDEIEAIFRSSDHDARRYASKRVTTFIVHGKVYQFVHRIYPTPLHVIGGFDLGPSMLFYDGHQVYTNSFGAFCIAMGVIVGDVSRRSPSYESRITRYMQDKGLALVLCNTDAKTLAHGMASELAIASALRRESVHISIAQGLTLKIKAREANVMVRFNATHGFETLFSIVGAKEKSSDYSLMPAVNWHDLGSHNVRMAMAGQMDQLICCYDDEGNATFPVPHVTRFQEFLATRSCSRSFFKLFWPTASLSEMRRPLRRWMYEFTSREMAFLFSQLRHALSMIQAVQGGGGAAGHMEWLTENPGRQWTGSFQPLETGISWYHQGFRRPLQIGIPHDIYCLLHCAQVRKQSLFRFINRDAFRKILWWICRLMAEEMEHKLLGVE